MAKTLNVFETIKDDDVIYLVEVFNHIEESIYLVAEALNVFETIKGDDVIYLVEDFDHIEQSLNLVA